MADQLVNGWKDTGEKQKQVNQAIAVELERVVQKIKDAMNG